MYPVCTACGLACAPAVERFRDCASLALIRGGGMHALINKLDENLLLFIFGGYD
jgi:hypothetical protein